MRRTADRDAALESPRDGRTSPLIERARATGTRERAVVVERASSRSAQLELGVVLRGARVDAAEELVRLLRLELRVFGAHLGARLLHGLVQRGELRVRRHRRAHCGAATTGDGRRRL